MNGPNRGVSVRPASAASVVLGDRAGPGRRGAADQRDPAHPPHAGGPNQADGRVAVGSRPLAPHRSLESLS